MLEGGHSHAEWPPFPLGTPLLPPRVHDRYGPLRGSSQPVLIVDVDPDYRLLFLGLEAGRRDSAPLVDARDFPEIDALLEAEGLKEKAPLTADALDARGVAAVIDAHRTPPEFREWERWCRRERARAMRAARRAGLAARARRFARGLLSWRR